MSRRPLLLDLFSGAGGAAMGYHRAGFDVVGVDHRPQPRYPFPFCEGDALEVLQCLLRGDCFRPGEQGSPLYLEDFAGIHASPPCQGYSRTRNIRRGECREYADLVAPTRRLLIESGKPWVIENVSGAPLTRGATIMLCGTYFGLKVIRHRYFEASVLLMAPAVECAHPPRGSVGRAGRGAGTSGFICVAGHLKEVSRAREAMGINWMTRDELSQAIPPAYTEFIGKQLRNALEAP